MSGRWLLPAGDTAGPTFAVHQQQSGPLAEIDFGHPAPLLQYRSLADLDDLAVAVLAAREQFAEVAARHAARPLVPLPDLPQREPGASLADMPFALTQCPDCGVLLAPEDAPRHVCEDAGDKAQHDSAAFLARCGADPGDIAALGAEPARVPDPDETRMREFLAPPPEQTLTDALAEGDETP